MKTTNRISRLVTRNTRPESHGRRSLAMESMEDRMVMTAAMPADAPDVESEQFEVATNETDTTMDATSNSLEDSSVIAKRTIAADAIDEVLAQLGTQVGTKSDTDATTPAVQNKVTLRSNSILNESESISGLAPVQAQADGTCLEDMNGTCVEDMTFRWAADEPTAAAASITGNPPDQAQADGGLQNYKINLIDYGVSNEDLD